jgi:hypothetical protein
MSSVSATMTTTTSSSVNTHTAAPNRAVVTNATSTTLTRSFSTKAASQQQQADSVWARRFSSEFQQSLRKSIKLLSDRGQWWFAEAWVQKDDGYAFSRHQTNAADSSDFFFFFFFFFFFAVKNIFVD